MNPLPQSTSPQPDIWFDWLVRTRHGGDPRHEQVIRGELERIRDRVLLGAQLSPDMTLVDVGSGDGLIAFGALARTAPPLRVILTDISVALLEHAERSAVERGVRDQCTFLHTPAEQLPGIANDSIDVVTTRAVLAYVADKAAALREFYRVLRPGGRISIAEPIFRDNAQELVTLHRMLGVQSAPLDPRLRLFLRWKSAQFPSSEELMENTPITNFSERYLVSLCQLAGFGEIHLELHIDIRKKFTVSWETFLDLSPHPQAPSLRTIMRSDFNEEERRELEAYLRPQVESEQGYERTTIAYLTAIKPELGAAV